MGLLSNPRHELFAQERAKGLSASEAYIKIGFKKNDSNAGRLNRNEHVQSRIAELQLAAAEATGLTIQWVLDGLKENYERAMQHVEVKDHKGLGTGEYKYEGAVANKALELVGRHLGAFPSKVELSGSVSISHEDALKELE